MSENTTPKFNNLLDGYFSGLELDEKGGQWRDCRFSGEAFYVRPEDVDFYRRIRVPLPTLKPEERQRRRLASINNYNLFKKKSDFSGKSIVSLYPPDSPYKVYEHDHWYGDRWNPMDFGREIEINEPFFDQFHNLRSFVPRPNLITDKSNINSDYTNTSKGLKNCYFVFDQINGENLYYHQCCVENRNCMDCWALDYCDSCYGSKFSEKLFNCRFVEFSENCLDSIFLWDCRGCNDCFMSRGLRNKKFYFRNEYIGEEEYRRKMKEINLGSYKVFGRYLEEFREMKRKAPRKPFWNKKSVNVIGDFVYNSKNIYLGIYAINSENMAYTGGSHGSRDCYDASGSKNELCYEMENTWAGNNYMCKFSLQIDNCRFVEYSEFCRNCEYCFGCVGLDNKRFCILNRQYSERDYWLKVDEIKAIMLERGEYGELFSPRHMVFPYRISSATTYSGFDDFETAGKYGYDISELIEETAPVPEDVVKAINLPDDIRDVSDDILDKVIEGEEGKHFRIIKPELEFYRQNTLPLPRRHPITRMHGWYKEFDIRITVFDRTCHNCGKNIKTGYSPERPEIVYCEECYQGQLD